MGPSPPRCDRQRSRRQNPLEGPGFAASVGEWRGRAVAGERLGPEGLVVRMVLFYPRTRAKSFVSAFAILRRSSRTFAYAGSVSSGVVR